MTIKLLGLAAAFALVPGVILAQTSSKTTPPDRGRHPAATTSASSAGEIAENVPPKAIEEQKDPNLIGSPAWWTTHATADGKPLSAEGMRAKEKKTP
jgi:hypothetical protein